MKYKHAMEIIENWERAEVKWSLSMNPSGKWEKAPGSPDGYGLGMLNDPTSFRIKREPRRVWVNFDVHSGMHGYGSCAVAMAKCDFDCKESAVEFVEVIK